MRTPGAGFEWTRRRDSSRRRCPLSPVAGAQIQGWRRHPYSAGRSSSRTATTPHQQADGGPSSFPLAVPHLFFIPTSDSEGPPAAMAMGDQAATPPPLCRGGDARAPLLLPSIATAIR